MVGLAGNRSERTGVAARRTNRTPDGLRHHFRSEKYEKDCEYGRRKLSRQAHGRIADSRLTHRVIRFHIFSFKEARQK
jgi:hypothetical protein